MADIKSISTQTGSASKGIAYDEPTRSIEVLETTKFKRDKKYWQAVGVMIGYIIGVGMFGLPLITAKAGLFLFFAYLFVLGAIQYFVHLIYANLIVVTEGHHRLSGYVERYMGHRAKIMVFIAKMTGNYGALLAYIVISGIFLHQLLAPVFGGSPVIYSTILFVLEAIIVFFGIKMISRVELYMSGLLILVVALMAFKGLGMLEAENYISLDWKFSLLPFGAMLMALDGNGSLPIVSKILNKDKKKIKSVIRASMIISSLITAVFVLSIVGISGSNTTDDALTGVKMIMDNGVIMFALVFGIFSMITSFIGVSEALKEAMWWDFGLNKNLAWALAVFVPFILFHLGFNDLIHIISFAGAIAGGFCGIMLMRVFMRIKNMPGKIVLFKRHPSNRLIYVIIFLYSIAMTYNMYLFLFDYN